MSSNHKPYWTMNRRPVPGPMKPQTKGTEGNMNFRCQVLIGNWWRRSMEIVSFLWRPPFWFFIFEHHLSFFFPFNKMTIDKYTILVLLRTHVLCACNCYRKYRIIIILSGRCLMRCFYGMFKLCFSSSRIELCDYGNVFSHSSPVTVATHLPNGISFHFSYCFWALTPPLMRMTKVRPTQCIVQMTQAHFLRI